MRGYRAEQQLSQEELAHRAGLHRTFLSSVESGKRNLSYTNVVKIADGLGVPTSELIARAEQLQRTAARR
jgi:transcriptional regulator with XRE-family HTH domain